MAATTLPYEVIATIVDCLEQWHDDSYKKMPLAPYAAISRAFQASIERFTFSHLALTPARLKDALASPTLFNCRRLAAVRHIDLLVELPAYDKAARSHVETDADRAANNAVFTQTIQDLFQLMARGSTSGSDGDVELTLSARSPGDNYQNKVVSNERDSYMWREHVPENGDLRQARYDRSYLELVVDENTLPLLPMITKFTYGDPPWGRHVAPAACAQLATRMPRLRSIEWDLSDNEKRDLAGRRARRAAMARVLPRLPSSVDTVWLLLEYDVKNELYPHPVPLLADGEQTDSLSAVLGRWARRCVEFLFDGLITTDFWTGLAGDDSDGTDAPRLSLLTVVLSKVLPTGEWLLMLRSLSPHDDPRQHEYDSGPYYDEYDFSQDDAPAPEDTPDDLVHRFAPDPRLWNPILLACARAVAHLPRLRVLRVRITDHDPGGEVVFRAEAHVVTFASFPNGIGAERLYHRGENRPLEGGDSVFRPNADVVQAWRAATRVQGAGFPADVRVVDITSNLYDEDEYIYRP